MNSPKVMAEVGCNHRGDMATAKEMIHVAAYFCKVDVIKFQKRNPKELLTPTQYSSSHPNSMHSYGKTYGEHREFLELSLEEHRQLKEWCEECGTTYSTSVWDLTSAKEISTLQPELIKIPSASNQHYEMLSYLCDNFGGQLHVSVGMTTHAEEDLLVDFFEKRGRAKDLVIYSCTSGYPVAFEDICLLEIPRLQKKFGDRVAEIGFSGHHLGIATDIAAMTLGASWIERHFTLNRTWKGTDHAASLEPDGMRRLARDVKKVSLALREKQTELLEVEIEQREKLKFRLD